MPEPVARELEGSRVCLVLATSTGGTGRHVRVLAAALVAGGAQVRVCGPAATEATFGMRQTGAGFVPVEIAEGLRPVADAVAAVRLRGVVAHADLVHAHGLRAGLLAGVATPRHVPLVVTWHNAVLTGGWLRRLYAALEQVVARRADVTLCVSPDLVERVRRLGGRSVAYEPVSAPVLPPPRRCPVEVRAELDAGVRPVVLTVARLHEQKGYPTLLAAAQRLAERDPPPLFVVAGDGPLRGRLQREIDLAGAPVRLLGSRTDVAELLAAADLVVLPSRWEGSPLAAQEALRAGRPFIGTRVGGLASLVGAAGLLVPPGDAEALAAAVARVLDDPGLAAELAARARLAAASLPTDDSVAARVLEVYRRLLSARTAITQRLELR